MIILVFPNIVTPLPPSPERGVLFTFLVHLLAIFGAPIVHDKLSPIPLIKIRHTIIRSKIHRDTINQTAFGRKLLLENGGETQRPNNN